MSDTDVRLPTLDPRIRARREAVEAEGRRQSRRRLMIAGGAVGLVAAAAGLVWSPVLDVDRVEVSGAVEAGPEEVEGASGVRPGDPMAVVDASSVERRLRALPWVAEASVVRRWPGVVELHVVERTAVAAVPLATGHALVDGTGRVVETVASPPGLPSLLGLPVVGPPGSSLAETAAPALELLELLPPEVASQLTSVETAGDRSLSATLAGRQGDAVDVVLGPPTELSQKAVALVTLVERADLRGARTIDLRVPTAPVLTR